MFSVVIPAYNCEKTIECVIESVLSQTAFDLIDEVVIINDGSTDGTENIIKNLIENKKLGDLIHYVYQENHGVSYTRNKGIELAKAEWIALLDSDDIWLSNKIERQAEVINKIP